jgi:hypothetical protein
MLDPESIEQSNISIDIMSQNASKQGQVCLKWGLHIGYLSA